MVPASRGWPGASTRRRSVSCRLADPCKRATVLAPLVRGLVLTWNGDLRDAALGLIPGRGDGPHGPDEHIAAAVGDPWWPASPCEAASRPLQALRDETVFG